jgi:UDP-glucose 4-epimerase
MSDPVLVTGGTGLAGRHVIAALERRGIPTVRIARTAAPGWHVADLMDRDSIDRLPPFSAVVHCAGLTPRRPDLAWDAFERANVDATQRLAEAAIRTGAKRFVLVSTLGRSVRARQTAVGRRYVVSKRLAERAVRRAGAGRMDVWIVRAASMYGEGDRGSMARLIRAIARSRFVLPGNGAQRKCLCYAGTLGDAIADGLASPEWPSFRRESAYDLEAPRMRDLVRIIERSTGGHALRVPAPHALIALAAATAARIPVPVVRQTALGLTIALREVPCEGPNLLDRSSAPVALADAIGREVEWLRGTGSI